MARRHSSEHPDPGDGDGPRERRPPDEDLEGLPFDELVEGPLGDGSEPDPPDDFDIEGTDDPDEPDDPDGDRGTWSPPPVGHQGPLPEMFARLTSHQRKAVRVTNLLLLLLNTPGHRWSMERLTAEVPGYEDVLGQPQALKARFDEDKADLRALGVDLVSEAGGAHQDRGAVYSIPRRDNALLELRLDPPERAAVGLAIALWQVVSSDAGALAALGAVYDARAVPDVPFHVDPALFRVDPNVQVAMQAAQDRKELSFEYRGTRDATPARRTVEPWGVVLWRGRWYLVGRDRDRAERRTFLCSRIVGRITVRPGPPTFARPQGVDLTSGLETFASPVPTAMARVSVDPGTAAVLRSVATSDTRDGQGRDVLEIPYGDPARLAALVAGCAGAATPLAPPTLVADVRDLLAGHLAVADVSDETLRAAEDALFAAAPRPTAPAGKSPPRRPALTRTVLHVQRMARLLAYLHTHPGVRPETVAAEFGVSLATVQSDIRLLDLYCVPKHVLGTYNSGIDIAFSPDGIRVHSAAGLDRPLRPTAAEARALVLGLVLVERLRLLPDASARTALAKVLRQVPVLGVDATGPRGPGATVLEAVRAGEAVEITYYSYGRDAVSTRVIDPIREFPAGGELFVNAWCRSARDVRTFHLGRVRAATLLGEPSDPPPLVREAVLARPARPYVPAPHDLVVRLLLAPRGRWLTEYGTFTHLERVADRSDGWTVAELRVASLPWLQRRVLGLGPAVAVLAPAAFATLCAEAARAGLAQLPDPGPIGGPAATGDGPPPAHP